MTSSKARFGTLEDLLAELPPGAPPHVPLIAWALRRVIVDGMADVVEVVRLGDGAASYGIGAKKMSESHVCIIPKKEYVNLAFYHGTDLPDPDRMLEGTGKKMRHAKVRTVEEAGSPGVRTLIEAALAERRAQIGLA